MWGFDRATFMWALARWLPAGVPGPTPDPYQTIALEVLVDVPPIERYRLHLGHGLPAAAFDGVPGEWVTFTCPDCWRVSHNPNDAAQRYCGACSWWTGDRSHGEPPGGRARPVWERQVPRLLSRPPWAEPSSDRWDR
jgi:hypothetical protein